MTHGGSEVECGLGALCGRAASVFNNTKLRAGAQILLTVENTYAHLHYLWP